MSDHTSDPAPAAGGPRAAERYIERNVTTALRNVWEVAYMDGERCDRLVGLGLTKEDAEFLAHGPGELARLRAENAKLRAALEALCGAAENAAPQLAWGYLPDPLGGPTLADVTRSARAALAAAPPEPA